MAKRKKNKSRGQIVVANEVRRSARNKDRVDRFSDLPDDILLHIMNFMDTRDAVQTCVLSKRWKNLCKCLTNLTFDRHCPIYLGKIFETFVSWVLTSRDESCSLLKLVVENQVDLAVVDRVSKYAVCHGVKQLKMEIISTGASFESLPLICSCHTLTSLTLRSSLVTYDGKILPKSLHMPALKRLELHGFTFSASDNDCAEPFSNCHVLSILVLRCCHLPNDARVLDICNSSLSNLTISRSSSRREHECKIVLSTPNLVSCTIVGLACHHLSSNCNLSFLEKVNIFDWYWYELRTSSIVIRWLQVLANVKILTMTSNIILLIKNDLSKPNLMMSKPPSFTRLESLTVKEPLPKTIYDEDVTRPVDYLLQNSQMVKVDLITFDSRFIYEEFFG